MIKGNATKQQQVYEVPGCVQPKNSPLNGELHSSSGNNIFGDKPKIPKTKKIISMCSEKPYLKLFPQLELPATPSLAKYKTTGVLPPSLLR